MIAMTIIRNKQTGLEIEGDLLPSYEATFFTFKIPGTEAPNTFFSEDWDIINTPKEGVYAFVIAGETDPNPHTRVVKYRAGQWRNAGGFEAPDMDNPQASYERGELRRLTFATDD